jgi:hypothetical protein
LFGGTFLEDISFLSCKCFKTTAGPYLCALLFAEELSYIFFPRRVFIKQVLIWATDIFVHEITVS